MLRSPLYHACRLIYTLFCITAYRGTFMAICIMLFLHRSVARSYLSYEKETLHFCCNAQFSLCSAHSERLSFFYILWALGSLHSGNQHHFHCNICPPERSCLGYISTLLLGETEHLFTMVMSTLLKMIHFQQCLDCTKIELAFIS